MTRLETAKAALAGFIEQVMGRVDFHAMYPCRVVAQNEDLTLELRPDSPRFGLGLSRVPLRLGIPGVTVKVKKDARVMLGFEGGDERFPVATLWEADGLDELTVTAAVKVTVSAPKVVLAQNEGNARPLAVVGSICKVTYIDTVTGLPNEAYGFVTDGVQTVTAE